MKCGKADPMVSARSGKPVWNTAQFKVLLWLSVIFTLLSQQNTPSTEMKQHFGSLELVQQFNLQFPISLPAWPCCSLQRYWDPWSQEVANPFVLLFLGHSCSSFAAFCLSEISLGPGADLLPHVLLPVIFLHWEFVPGVGPSPCSEFTCLELLLFPSSR